MRQVDMAIIGAGECGARAAFTLREEGFDGSVLLVGDEKEAPYERPPLSKVALLEGEGPRLVADRASYSGQGIELVTGMVVLRLDPAERTILLSSGETIGFGCLLLATGARPRRLAGIDPASNRILALRSAADAASIRSHLGPGRNLSILGGGFIGLELAAIARAMGTAVTVIETQPRVLVRGVPVVLAGRLAARHQAEGVAFVCGVPVASVEEAADGVTINLGDGRSIRSDCLVTGIGAMPNVELAAEAGLAVDNGIAVNERLETSAPGIWAAGDCCSAPMPLYDGRRVRLEAWRNAQDQGRLAARNMLGAAEPQSHVPWFWSDQYDLTLQVAGLAEGATTWVRREIAPDAEILFHLDSAGRLLAASGLSRGNQVARDIRLAEMLIAARATPDPAALKDPATKLKSLLS